MAVVAPIRRINPVIRSAYLIDLIGSKILSEMSFENESIVKTRFGLIMERVYDVVEREPDAECTTISAVDFKCLVGRLDERTALLCVIEGEQCDAEEMSSFKKLRTAIQDLIASSSALEEKDSFPSMASDILQKEVRVCFISPSKPLPGNRTGLAVSRIVEQKKKNGSFFTSPFSFGPLGVRFCQIDLDAAASQGLPSEMQSCNVYTIVVNSEAETDEIRSVVSRVREVHSDEIVIVPGHEECLELARNLEYELDLVLSDASSGDSTHLVLSTLAMSGLTDMHPELAMKRWRTELFEKDEQDRVLSEEKVLGHQAFFVVDKNLGDAVYTYYYESKSTVLSRAPNIVAALSMFNVESMQQMKTEVFKAGNLTYIMIERGDLIFTLITGNRGDVDELRQTFSFLPDLYADEQPEEVAAGDDLYASPPFTLKLLATLPPETLSNRMAPYRLSAPDWDRFKSELVRDFLMAVWNTVDGSLTIETIVQGAGPKMSLGAIHLLKALDSIGFDLLITSEDIPQMSSPPDPEVLKLYADLERILRAVDGAKTIKAISGVTGIDVGVVLHVLRDLHKRGMVAFK